MSFFRECCIFSKYNYDFLKGKAIELKFAIKYIVAKILKHIIRIMSLINSFFRYKHIFTLREGRALNLELFKLNTLKGKYSNSRLLGLCFTVPHKK